MCAFAENRIFSGEKRDLVRAIIILNHYYEQNETSWYINSFTAHLALNVAVRFLFD